MLKDEEKTDFDFAELTEFWRDGRFNIVVNHIQHSEQFSIRANLIDFCVYFNKYVGKEELKILQKLI
jgi:hypothetical protein